MGGKQATKLLKQKYMQDHVWQAVLGEIEVSVSRASYVTWFKNTRMLRYENGVLTIGVPNIFIKQQLERKFNQLIADALKHNGVEPKSIEYKIHSGTIHKKIVEENAVVLDRTPRSASTPSKSSSL